MTLNCLKLRSVICTGIRNEQTDWAVVEEGMVSGSSMWSTKCSEPKCGSFVHLWRVFQSPPSKAARSSEWRRGYVSNLSHDNKPSVLMPVSQCCAAEFPERCVKSAESVCSLCSLTGSDISSLPLHYAPKRAGVSTWPPQMRLMKLNSVKSDGGATPSLTVAGASGIRESDTHFCFLAALEMMMRLHQLASLSLICSS